MNMLWVLVPQPGSSAAKRIAPGSAVVCRPTTDSERTVYFEGNLYDAVNLRNFEERVLCASGRLWTRYPTVAFGVFPAEEFAALGDFQFSDDWKQYKLTIYDPGLLNIWTLVTPAIFKQKVPCLDCPFRKDEGGVRHSPAMMASYAKYFLTAPGATFPCHRSVPEEDTREVWSEWQPGQVLCAGGLLLAAKLGRENHVIKMARMNGWYDPASHGDAERALVFDSVTDMIHAGKEDA